MFLEIYNIGLLLKFQGIKRFSCAPSTVVPVNTFVNLTARVCYTLHFPKHSKVGGVFERFKTCPVAVKLDWKRAILLWFIFKIEMYLKYSTLKRFTG